jgi:hypothetical protein
LNISFVKLLFTAIASARDIENCSHQSINLRYIRLNLELLGLLRYLSGK